MDLRQRHRIIPCVAVQGAGCKAHFVLTPPPQPPQPAYLDTFNVQILSYTPIQNLEQDADYNLQPPPIFDYVTTIDVPLAIVIGTFPACTRLSSPGWSDTIDHIDSPDNFNWTIWNGTHIHVDPSDACESAWEKAWSSITNFISGAVNWVADAYNGHRRHSDELRRDPADLAGRRRSREHGKGLSCRSRRGSGRHRSQHRRGRRRQGDLIGEDRTRRRRRSGQLVQARPGRAVPSG
jgi:hypothetical protein